MKFYEKKFNTLWNTYLLLTNNSFLNFQQLTSVCLWLMRKWFVMRRSWKSMFKFSALLCLLCLYPFFVLHSEAWDSRAKYYDYSWTYRSVLYPSPQVSSLTKTPQKILLIDVVTFKEKYGELNENYAIKQSFLNHSYLNEACLSCTIPWAPRKKFHSCISFHHLTIYLSKWRCSNLITWHKVWR